MCIQQSINVIQEEIIKTNIEVKKAMGKDKLVKDL